MRCTKHTLPNGLRVLTVPMQDNPTVTVLVLVEAGTQYETKAENGISHLLEHMVFKGTTRRPKAITISYELDALGAIYNAFTSREYTGYYAKADFKHADTMLDIVSDMYQNPLFDEKELEKEKGVIVEEIRMYEDEPKEKVGDVFDKLMYGDQPAGWTIAGDESTVRSISREQLFDYRKQHYLASSTVVVVAGRFDEMEMVKKVQAQFANIATNTPHKLITTATEQSAPAIATLNRKADQVHLVLGLRSVERENPLLPALKVLRGVLSGGMSTRLFQKLRDELGLVYYAHASQSSSKDHGHFTVSAGVNRDKVGEALSAILYELKRLAYEPVSLPELKKVKDSMIGRLYLGLESSDDLAEYYGFGELLRKEIRTPEMTVAEIEAVTVEDIQKAARFLCVDSHLNLAIVGPAGDEQVLRGLLHFSS